MQMAQLRPLVPGIVLLGNQDRKKNLKHELEKVFPFQSCPFPALIFVSNNYINVSRERTSNFRQDSPLKQNVCVLVKR